MKALRSRRREIRRLLAYGLLVCLCGPAYGQESASSAGGLPPGLAAAVQKDNSSALPPTGDVSPRAPGLQLPPVQQAGESAANPFAGASSNPFAPPVEVVKTQEQVLEEVRLKAFNAAITGLLPMKPEEIRQMLERYDQTRQAVETPVYPYPKPEIVTQDIMLDPGTLPPVVKLAIGHVTVVNFVDITGAPWPIQDIAWAGNFEVIKSEEGGSKVGVSPMSDFAYGNMSVQLLEMEIPISFTLETQREKVHYRFDARIGEYGPYAVPPLVEGSGVSDIAAGAPELSAVLEGVSPKGSEKLSVDGVDGRTTAYALNGVTYVRTPLTLLSPAWGSSIASADGMNVYAVKNAPVLLLSDKGQVVRARLSERNVSHDE